MEIYWLPTTSLAASSTLTHYFSTTVATLKGLLFIKLVRQLKAFFGFEFENGSGFSEGEGNGFYFQISDPDRANETFYIDYSYSYHPFGLSGEPQYVTRTVEITTDAAGFGRSEVIRDENYEWYDEYSVTAEVRDEGSFGTIQTTFEDAQIIDKRGSLEF